MGVLKEKRTILAGGFRGTNYQKGFIPLDLSSLRVIATNDIPAKGTPDGGTISLDTDPKFTRINAATDKGQVVTWASASVIEATFPAIPLPPDIDITLPIVVNLLAKMAAASVDTPTIAVSAFVGIGDTNAGGNTAALSTTLTQVTVSIAATDLAAYPTMIAIGIKPGTHATSSNDVLLYGAWLTYTKLK